MGIEFADLDDIVAATGFWASREARIAAAETGAADADGSAGCDGDAVLAQLLIAARTDELAARVTLQRLLPGLTSRARRWAHRPDGSPEALDELVSAAWSVIRTFPVEARGTHLAARLLRDAEYQAFVRPSRRRGVQEPTEPALLDLPAPTESSVDPLQELADLVALARARSLPERDLAMVQLLVHGLSMAEVAAALKVSLRSVTTHRDSMVRRLREAARADLAA